MDLRVLADAALMVLWATLALTLTTLAVYVLLTRAGRDAMRVGCTSLGRHPLRTLLALIGVVTGVAVVVAVISIGDGTRAMVLDEVAATGGTSIIEIVRDDWNRQAGTTITSRSRRRWNRNRAKPLDYRDYENLDMMLTQVTAVCAEGDSRSGAQIRHADREKQAPVVGATTGYQEVYNWLVTNGRLFSAQDVEQAAKVAVLGARIATDLFGELDPVGGEIRLRRTWGDRQEDIRLSVIGVMEARTAATGSDGWNDRVILPPNHLPQTRHGRHRGQPSQGASHERGPGGRRACRDQVSARPPT